MSAGNKSLTLFGFENRKEPFLLQFIMWSTINFSLTTDFGWVSQLFGNWEKKSTKRSKFKLVSTTFYFFTKWYLLNIYEKFILFSLKGFFPSQNIQNFVFLPSPLFSCRPLLQRIIKINLKDKIINAYFSYHHRLLQTATVSRLFYLF